jgi:hypothetical protein
MSVNRTIPGVLLCAMLVACAAPSVMPSGPVATPVAEAPVAAAAVTPTPAATTGAAVAAPSPSPELTPSPSPTPRRRSSRNRAPQPIYQEAELGGLSVGNFTYAPGTTLDGVIQGTATMAITVDGRATTVQFEETDHPIQSPAFDTVRVTEGDNTRTFGADQEFGVFWIQAPTPLVYRLQGLEGGEEPELDLLEDALVVRPLPEGAYEIGRGLMGEHFIARTLLDAAEECLASREFEEASLAGLSALYAVIREGGSTYSTESPLAAFRTLSLGQPLAGSRFPMPPSIKKDGGRSQILRYQVLQAESEALNPAAALLKEIIRLRLESGPVVALPAVE